MNALGDVIRSLALLKNAVSRILLKKVA